MAFLGKEYKFVREEKFEEFFKAAGFPEDQVAKYTKQKPGSTKLVKDGDIYTYISTSSEGTRETSFKSGVEFQDKVSDKLTITTTYTVDGNKVTQKIKTEQGPATFVREYNGDELVVTMTSDKFDVVAKRWYKSA